MTPYRDRRDAGEFEAGAAASASKSAPAVDLDAMTKADMLAYARSRGIDVDPAASKADVRAVIEATG